MGSANKKINLPQLVREIETGPEETILDASLKNGINYPYSCKAGRCGRCKSRLLKGEVSHLSHNKFTLTQEEKDQGLFLACRAIPLNDVEVAWLQENNSKISPMLFSTILVVKEKLTHDTYRLVLRACDTFGLQFYPGQYALVTFPGAPSRNYSMANQPGSNEVEFYIRQVPGGKVSENILPNLELRTEVQIEGPFGNSYLDTSHTGPILAVGGGSGIAPIRSIIDRAISIGMRQPIYLYFGVREERDIYLVDYFRKLETNYPNFHFQIAIDRGSSDSGYFAGRVGDLVAKSWPSFEGEWRSYLAGPPLMVEGLSSILIDRGFDRDWIKSDPFY